MVKLGLYLKRGTAIRVRGSDAITLSYGLEMISLTPGQEGILAEPYLGTHEVVLVDIAGYQGVMIPVRCVERV